MPHYKDYQTLVQKLIAQVEAEERWLAVPLAEALERVSALIAAVELLAMDDDETTRQQAAGLLRSGWPTLRNDLGAAVRALTDELDGRKPSRPVGKLVTKHMRLLRRHGVPIAEISRKFGVSRPTVYRVLNPSNNSSKAKDG